MTRFIAFYLSSVLFQLAGFSAELPSGCPESLQVIAGANRKYRLPNPVAAAMGTDKMVSDSVFRSFWDPNLKTTIYHTASEPDKNGNIPLVDPNAKAVVIFFHGSGTEKSTGKTFASTALPLAKQGVAGISIDLPFHGANRYGSLNNDKKHFLRQLHEMISDIKKTGKKVILTGHSFGPDLAAEFAATYPKDLDQLVLFSPAPSQSKSHAWMYSNVTEKGMHLLEGGTDVKENVPGGEWAGRFSEQAAWAGGKIPESVKVNVVVGELDEWWAPRANGEKLPRGIHEIVPPGALPNIRGNSGITRALGVTPAHTYNEGLEWFQENIPHADINVVRGYGHYIFEAQDPRGGTVVLRSIMDATGVPYVAKPENKETSARLHLKLLSERSPAFREWLGNERGADNAIQTEAMAKVVLKQWEEANHLAWRKMLESDLETHYPDYFKNRRYSIAQELASSAKTLEELAQTGKTVSAEFISDFRNYLAKRDKFGAAALGPDPKMPSTPVIDARAISNSNGQTTGRESIRLDVLKEAISKVTDQFTVERVSDQLSTIRYTNNGKVRKEFALTHMSEAETTAFLQRAYHQAVVENGYLPIVAGKSFSTVVDGIKVEGKLLKADRNAPFVFSGIRIGKAP